MVYSSDEGRKPLASIGDSFEHSQDLCENRHLDLLCCSKIEEKFLYLMCYCSIQKKGTKKKTIRWKKIFQLDCFIKNYRKLFDY